MELLVPASFTDHAKYSNRRREASISTLGSGSSGRQSENGDRQAVYPFTIQHNGRLGGSYVLHADSPQIRLEWKEKLEEATGLRRVVQESNKVFEIETLTMHTFSTSPRVTSPTPSLPWTEGMVTGKVTCSIPFSMLSNLVL